jgi:hypothetical protein
MVNRIFKTRGANTVRNKKKGLALMVFYTTILNQYNFTKPAGSDWKAE